MLFPDARRPGIQESPVRSGPRAAGVLPLNCGTPEGTRTPHLLLRRQLLYPDELLAHMERVMGIEPTPTAWKAVVLAVILHPHIKFCISHKIVS